MPATDTTKLPLEGGPAYGLGEVDRQGATSPMLRGLDGLSLYEKKCVLINREIDSQGMGKYQWYIWGLCGFGYMLDLLWAQAFGLVLKPLQQEMGFGDGQSGNIATSFNAGLTAGAFVWGFLADIIGVGGNIPIDTTITLEFIPQIDEGPLLSCNNVAPGTKCCARVDNMGWRYLLFTLGGITLFVFVLRFFVFKFQETPKYLIYRGHDARAIQTLEHMAHVNGKRCGLTLEMFHSLESDENDGPVGSAFSASSGLGGGAKQTEKKWPEKVKLELGRYKMLFDGFPMIRLTVLVWLTYIMDFWGFTVAGHYLPSILALKNGRDHVSLSATYAAYIYTYAPGIVGVLLGALMYHVPAIGRKWTMVISSALMGISIILFSTVDTRAKNEGLFAMEYFFQSMFNAVLYGWTPEAFPAPVRGTACGVAGFWGRLFGIVSPLIAQHLYGQPGENGENGNINGVLYLAGGVMLGCVISTALLPNEMMETKDERSFAGGESSWAESQIESQGKNQTYQDDPR
ncbi:putative MFS-type transporter [Colletotrichum sp. SAR 10_99]|nr:putative MFS-type transporter [Colletotrichum sp. SAR 10_99]